MARRTYKIITDLLSPVQLVNVTPSSIVSVPQ